MEDHIAPSGAEHIPAGYLHIHYRLMSEDMPKFTDVPQGLVEPRQGREAGWDREKYKEPRFILHVDCTHINFALDKGVFSRFA